MLLSAEHLSINFGSRQLLSDVNLYLNEGDKVGIIGINGTGKSTLLRVLAGAVEPDAGTVSRNPNVQVSFLPQNPDMDDNATVLEQVFLSFPSEFRALNEYEAKAMLGRLGIPDVSQKIGTLSAGQRKRVALAAALIHPADVLILDEPTNHLDSEMVLWLEDRLKRFAGGIIMVTHDRYFLERVVNHITELSRGRLYHYEANYSRYLELKTQREEMAEASERKRQSILRVEREWILRGCRARTTKSKDRIERYEDLKARSAPEYDDSVQMAAAASRLGKKIIVLENVSKAFDGRTVLDHFSYSILRSDRIGIVGPNGVGKSTLLRIIAGELEPDSGTVDRGATVKIGYFSQEGRELDLNRRVYDFIHDIADEVRTDAGTFTANQMMERFLFPADLQSVPIGRLSGGERRRLYLLSVLMGAPNVLLLDEPTNDLDVTTLAILEDYLQSFPGPILAVSHDRCFWTSWPVPSLKCGLGAECCALPETGPSGRKNEGRRKSRPGWKSPGSRRKNPGRESCGFPTMNSGNLRPLTAKLPRWRRISHAAGKRRPFVAATMKSCRPFRTERRSCGAGWMKRWSAGCISMSLKSRWTCRNPSRHPLKNGKI